MTDIIKKLKSALDKTNPEEFKEKLEEPINDYFNYKSSNYINFDLDQCYGSGYSVTSGGYTFPYQGITGATGPSVTMTVNSNGTGATGPNGVWNTVGTSSIGNPNFRGLEVTGDIQWNGRSLTEMLKTIEDRLAILVPDPAKLEKYEALRKAYDHYILLEKLIGED